MFGVGSELTRATPWSESMRCIFALALGATRAAIVKTSPRAMVSRRVCLLFMTPPVRVDFMHQTLGGEPRRVVRRRYARSVKLVTLAALAPREIFGELWQYEETGRIIRSVSPRPGAPSICGVHGVGEALPQEPYPAPPFCARSVQKHHEPGAAANPGQTEPA